MKPLALYAEYRDPETDGTYLVQLEPSEAADIASQMQEREALIYETMAAGG